LNDCHHRNRGGILKFANVGDLNNNPLNYTASISGGVVNINVSTVPEPSSLALAAISGLSGVLV
jgi:hypothetical protein